MTPQYPYPADRFELVGRVTRSHGLKGEIKVLPLEGPQQDFNEYSRVALVADDGRMTDLLDIVRWRIQGKLVILKLATIDSKSEADLTAGMGVLCSRQDRPIVEGDREVTELFGLEVVTVDGKHVGTVETISHTGAHPLMIVVSNEEEIMIPVVEEMIVDRQETRIIIDPPPGLLDINAS